MEEFVSISDFVYKDYEIHNVGDGDSFCYCPCDIYGTPKLYYADCHFACAGDALQDILDSFHGGDANDVFNDDEWNNIVQDIWLDCISEPGRVFFGKYIVVGFDGHIPNREYVDGVILYLGGSYKDYAILYNEGGRVHELSCDNVINGTKNKPIKLGVPNEIIRLYDMKMSKMNMVNRKFPTNMTKAEYYSLIKQENKQNKNMDKKFIRLTESDLHRIVRKSVNKILKETVLPNGQGTDWDEPYDYDEPYQINCPTKDELMAALREKDWDAICGYSFDNPNEPLVVALQKAIDAYHKSFDMLERIYEAIAYGNLSTAFLDDYTNVKQPSVQP